MTFANGDIKKFDVHEYFNRSDFFDELKDWNYFKLVRPDYGTVVWPNGQDFCADTLFLDSVPL